VAKFSPQLTKMLLIRGIARALGPIAILWGIFDWWLINPLYSLIFSLLTLNYVLIYILSWVAPAAMNGPWRIRSWQTFVLIINAFALPIVFRNTFGQMPWGFITITLLFFVGLYASTVIYFQLNERLPMSSIFAARRTQTSSTTQPIDTKRAGQIA